MRLQDMTEPELQILMQCVGASTERTITRITGERPYFVTLVFNDPVMTQYVSNCERADIIKAMREAANRLDAGDEMARVEFEKPPTVWLHYRISAIGGFRLLGVYATEEAARVAKDTCIRTSCIEGCAVGVPRGVS